MQAIRQPTAVVCETHLYTASFGFLDLRVGFLTIRIEHQAGVAAVWGLAAPAVVVEPGPINP